MKGYFHLVLSNDDEYHMKNKLNLEIHRPRYALIYNNIIKDSTVDNKYYKVLEQSILKIRIQSGEP